MAAQHNALSGANLLPSGISPVTIWDEIHTIAAGLLPDSYDLNPSTTILLSNTDTFV